MISSAPPLNDRKSRSILFTKRRIFRWLVVGAFIFTLLLICGYTYEILSERVDEKKFQPPGEFVDVGGYHLHIHCVGSGSPTVVIESGLGDWSTGWDAVQNEVSKATKVCTYDRAGWGWSEQGPLPRDARRFASELHTLLNNANISGPLILVGHSLGGFSVRVFVHQYPTGVAGVVLVDSMSPKQISQPDNNEHIQPSGGFRPFSLPALLARFGVIRLLARPLGIMPIVPLNDGAYFARLVRPQSAQTFTDESLGMRASGSEAEKVKTFGDIPLVVITAKENSIKGWADWQAELLQLSSNSQQILVDSNHGVHFEKPEIINSALLQFVQTLRASDIK